MKTVDIEKLKKFLASKVTMMTDYDDGFCESCIDEYIDEFMAEQQTTEPCEDELKRCPFCGGEAEMSNSVDRFLGKFWYVQCKKCCSRGSEVYESGSKLEPEEEYPAIKGAWEKAIKAWNRREGEQE